MSSVRKQYPFDLIEPKWQRFWVDNQIFRAWNPGDSIPEEHPFAQRHPVAAGSTATSLPPKFYILDMFPYPSGSGLHVGHPEGYTATDILARYKRALGYNVLHPMGWDAFGLPAEQYAIKTGQHPRVTTEANVINFKRQIQSLGFSYDWSREIDTTHPGYFKWTQWIFLKLYNSWFNPVTHKAEPIELIPYPPALQSDQERGLYRDNKRLAFVSDAPVNWCPDLCTVLANEEVIDGKSEVGGFPVVRKSMRQWMLRITAYAERLLNDLHTIDWSHSLKEMQRNWIGRSEGAEIAFTVTHTQTAETGNTTHDTVRINVFTTRPDTLFGATYMVLSPEHKAVDHWLEIGAVPAQWPVGTPVAWTNFAANPAEAIRAYREVCSRKSDLERTDLAKEKTGVFTGVFATNPANSEPVPVWIADYVLATYGTGAIMAVPAHDARDLEFAHAFGLPVRLVVQAPDGQNSIGFLDHGTSVNSGFLNGLSTPEARKTITAWLEEKKVGRLMVNYKIRDWLFSRQRYWGEPFPIVWKDGCHHAIDDASLPLQPPALSDFKPTETGEPPLARATKWCQLPDGASRETNTMPQWAGSCWYYLRFLDATNARTFCGPQAERYWMGTLPQPESSLKSSPGVDLYVGGTEHAVLHLLYARFWHKVLFDLGYVSTSEPFYKLVNQGLILGEDGQKMSKSRGNVVNPDEILTEYGADAFRLYEMFMGPLEMVKPWNTQGVEGVYRFLGRVWRLFVDEKSETDFEQQQTVQGRDNPDLLRLIQLDAAIQDIPATRSQMKTLHACIKKVTEDLDHLRFNTGISALMIFVNEALSWQVKPKAVMRDFLMLLNPFSPHLAEELYAKLEPSDPVGTVAYQPWPKFDPSFLVEDTIEIPVQINGKVRDRVLVPSTASDDEIRSAALASSKIAQALEGRTILKIIVVPKKLVNIVPTS